MKRKIFFGIAFLLLICGGIHGEELVWGPMGRLKLGLFPGVGSSVFQQSVGGVQGERLFLKDRVGMETNRVMPDIELGIAGGNDSELYFSAFYGAFPGKKVLTQDLFFEGTTYPSGTDLGFSLQIFSAEAGILVDLTRGKKGFVQMGVGLRYGLFRTAMNADSLPYNRNVQEGLLPTFRFRGDLILSGFLSIYFDSTIGGFSYEEGIAGTSDFKKKQFFYFSLDTGFRVALVPGANFYLGFISRTLQFYRKDDNLIDRVYFRYYGASISFEVIF